MVPPAFADEVTMKRVPGGKEGDGLGEVDEPGDGIGDAT